MRIRSVAAALSATLLVAACGGTSDTAPVRSSAGTSAGPALFRPMYNVTSTAPGFNVPFPIDWYYSANSEGVADGTLNIPNTSSSALFVVRSSLNRLDGYSTTSAISARFTQPIAASSISAATVKLIEVSIDNATKATTGVRRILTYGTDYTAGLSPALDSGGTQLDITPLKPLTPSTGATNVGYLVVLTDGIKDTSGNSAAADTDFQLFKSSQPGCGLANATLKGLCQLIGAQLTIANATGTPPSSVVAAWSFSTQSIGDSLGILSTINGPQPIGVVPTGLTVAQATGGKIPATNANVYVGNQQLPYYAPIPDPTKCATVCQDAGPTSGRWLSQNPSPIDSTGTSFEITRFNPVPKKIADIKVPLLVTVPNNQPKPAAGWPVVIFLNGLTSDRTSMFAAAGTYAAAGYVLVSIDAPFHGITDPTSPLYQKWNPATKTGERTFDLDLLTFAANGTPSPAPDGKIDSSGFNLFLMLLQNPAGIRDALRQGALDIVVLTKSVPNLDLTGDGIPDIDPARINFAALSLGPSMAIPGLAQNINVKSAYLNAPVGNWAKASVESGSFSPLIKGLLFAASGGAIQPGTTAFEEWVRDTQAVVDAGDSLNYIKALVTARPALLTQVKNDGTAPNSVTQKLVLAGGFSKANAAGVVPVAAGAGKWVHFLQGSHSSMLDPAASAAVTAEMQSQSVSFLLSGGTAFQISAAGSALLEP